MSRGTLVFWTVIASSNTILTGINVIRDNAAWSAISAAAAALGWVLVVEAVDA